MSAPISPMYPMHHAWNPDDVEASLARIYGLPDEDVLLSHSGFLLEIHEKICLTYPSPNPVLMHSRDLIEQTLEAKISHTAASMRTRKERYGFLTDFPLYSILPLIFNEAESYRDALLNLVVAILNVRGPCDAGAFRELDNVRVGRLLSLPTEVLADIAVASRLELITMTEALGIKALSRFLKPKIKRNLRSKNQMTHKSSLVDDDALEIDSIVTTNADGEILHEGIEVSSKVTLSKAQRRRQFRLKKAGLLNAISRQNSLIVNNVASSTVAEFGAFFEATFPSIFAGYFESETKTSCYVAVNFLLSVLGIQKPSELRIINANSDTQPERQRGDLVYKKYKSKNKQMSAGLYLNTRLVDEKVGSDAEFYSTEDLFYIALPHPIPALLTKIFDARKSSKAIHTRQLHEVAAIDDSNVESWLNDKLKSQGFRAKGITLAKLKKSFHHCAATAVLDVTRSFLSQKSCVQNYYMALPEPVLGENLKTYWRGFLKAAGVNTDTSMTNEEKSSTGLGIEEVWIGSAGVQSYDEITAQFALVVAAIEQSTERVSLFNCVNCYIALRLMFDCALRPRVGEFPNLLEQSNSLMLVKEKQVRKNELRPVIQSEPINALVSDLRPYLSTLGRLLTRSSLDFLPARIVENTHGQRTVLPLTKTDLAGQLKALNIKLDIRFLRKSSASDFAKQRLESDHFNQVALNRYLNHWQAGREVWSPFSLVSVDKLSQLDKREKMRTSCELIKSMDRRVVEQVRGAR